MGKSNRVSKDLLGVDQDTKRGKGEIIPSEMPRDSPLFPVHIRKKHRLHTKEKKKQPNKKPYIISRGPDPASLAGPLAMRQGTGNTYQVPLQGKEAMLSPKAKICVPRKSWQPRQQQKPKLQESTCVIYRHISHLGSMTQ